MKWKESDNDMNENKMKEFPICQFYIAIGVPTKELKNDKKNKYFPVSGKEDTKLIQYAIMEEYKKKRKEGYAVASEIICLVTNENDKKEANELLDKLKFKGKIVVIPPKKEELPKEPIERLIETKEEEKETKKEEEKEKIKEEPINREELFNNIRKREKTTTEPNEEPMKKIIKDNVFHGDNNNSLKKSSKPKTQEEEAARFMGWDEDLLKPKKLNKKRKLDLPVIIFILSFIVLAVAIILLLILK